MKRKTKINLASFITWLTGASIIYILWDHRVFVNDAAETIFGFVLYVVAFFYVLAWQPIRDFFEFDVFKEEDKE